MSADQIDNYVAQCTNAPQSKLDKSAPSIKRKIADLITNLSLVGKQYNFRIVTLTEYWLTDESF